MKEILNKFYNININDYKEYNNGIIFVIGSDNYYLCKCNNINIDNVLELYDYVRSVSNIKLHTIVINNNGNVVSDDYILFKLNVLISEIDYKDVMEFNLCKLDGMYIGFNDEWVSKLDYFDNVIDELNTYGSYDYFKGIVENLIKFIKDFDGSKYNLCLSHFKVCLNTIEFYNPINLCIDIMYRDIVNYVRYCDYKKNIFNYIDPSLIKYAFVYMVVPNEYFDNLINGYIKEYVDNIDDYERYLLEVEELFNIYLFEHIKRSN